MFELIGSYEREYERVTTSRQRHLVKRVVLSLPAFTLLQATQLYTINLQRALGISSRKDLQHYIFYISRNIVGSFARLRSIYFWDYYSSNNHNLHSTSKVSRQSEVARVCPVQWSVILKLSTHNE